MEQIGHIPANLEKTAALRSDYTRADALFWCTFFKKTTWNGTWQANLWTSWVQFYFKYGQIHIPYNTYTVKMGRGQVEIKAIKLKHWHVEHCRTLWKKSNKKKKPECTTYTLSLWNVTHTDRFPDLITYLHPTGQPYEIYSLHLYGMHESNWWFSLKHEQ